MKSNDYKYEDFFGMKGKVVVYFIGNMNEYLIL